LYAIEQADAGTSGDFADRNVALTLKYAVIWTVFSVKWCSFLRASPLFEFLGDNKTWLILTRPVQSVRRHPRPQDFRSLESIFWDPIIIDILLPLTKYQMCINRLILRYCNNSYISLMLKKYYMYINRLMT
jgi:hypothetical protein